MATQKLIAVERFYYAGRNVEQGEEFDAEEADVSLLTHSVSPRAKLAEAEPRRGEADKADELGRTEKPDSEPQGARMKYKRRDMKAQD